MKMQHTINEPMSQTEYEQYMAKLNPYAARAAAATAKAAEALERLLVLAETRDSGQIHRIALFLGAVWHGARHFDLYELRGLDVPIGDDMLAVLDGLRWAKMSVGDMTNNGDRRIQDALIQWGMFGPNQTGQVIAARS